MRPSPSKWFPAGGDVVGIDHADVRIEPAFAIPVQAPQAVEERLHCRHFIALPRLHLRGRPVDRVDLGREASSEPKKLSPPFVNIIEMIAIRYSSIAVSTPAPVRVGSGL